MSSPPFIYLFVHALRACTAVAGCGCALSLTGVEGIDGLEVLGVESDGLRLHHHDLGLDLHGWRKKRKKKQKQRTTSTHTKATQRNAVQCSAVTHTWRSGERDEWGGSSSLLIERGLWLYHAHALLCRDSLA